MPCPPVTPVRPLKVGILVVSDTASQDASTDRSGPVLRETFGESPETWSVAALSIVPDSIPAIQSQITQWTAENLNLVITTGGTGFAIRDVTPEALTPLIEKSAPGIVHAMLATSFNITPYAAMARPVAGVRGETLVIAVPGSPKAAKENVLAVMKLLPHACDLACGGNSRAMHTERGVAESGKGVMSDKERIKEGHSHSHDHSHGHGHKHGGVKPRTTEEQRTLLSNQLGGKVTQRHRTSPYPMFSVPEATEKILTNTHALPITSLAVDENLVGYILAEDIKAPDSVPAFRASIVDGYAVLSTDGEGVYPVTQISHASASSPQPLQAGQIARITTGAPLPPGSDAVIMVEDTLVTAETPEGEEQEVRLLASVPYGENVREIGSDVEKGSVILRKGTEITFAGGEVGILASVGVAEVKVWKKPVVGVLSTGNELVRHTEGRELALGEVRDSNRPSLLTVLKAWGYEGVDLGIASDTPGALETILKDALEKVDVIITTGGVSMGELDLLKPTIERSLSGTIHFGRVAMKPGKPTTFATVPASNATKHIFALPGNPASAIVTFHLFVLPSLRKASGMEKPMLPIARVALAQDVKLDPRPEYHRVFISVTAEGGLLAVSTGGQRSSRVGSLTGANGLLCLPSSKDISKQNILKGEIVDALILGRLGGI